MVLNMLKMRITYTKHDQHLLYVERGFAEYSEFDFT